MFRVKVLVAGIAGLAILGLEATAHAQTFGIELHNTMMPASGGMAGASIALPQDLLSSANANPATLTQFRGTQFAFSGGWGEGTFNMTQLSPLPADPSLDTRVFPYSAKSTAPGLPIANIGISQDLAELGLPATVAFGFMTTAGAFVDFRHIPESDGTNSGQTIFNAPAAIGVDMTDRWSLGASMSMGIALNDGPFVGSSGITPDYALRGTVGSNYELTEFTNIGGYYQTGQSFTFDNAVLINPGPDQRGFDSNMDLPQNVGLGIANHRLMNGKLLLATDVLYKLWDEAEGYKALYDNQWVVQIGAQYTMGRYRLRAGYAWAENPLDQTPESDVGGVEPIGELPGLRYVQGLLAITCQHRMTFGLGVVDILPGIDLDMQAGGMFEDGERLGEFTMTSIESYWLAAGLTWKFRRGACEALPIANSWRR
jgi:long-chain fatty acid transport protein